MVTVSQAKSQLSAFIKAAEAGEQVVIMRGSKPAVLLRPISELDLDFYPQIPDSALADFEAEILRDRKSNSLIKLGDTPTSAASTLKRQLKRSR